MCITKPTSMNLVFLFNKKSSSSSSRWNCTDNNNKDDRDTVYQIPLIPIINSHLK